MKIEVGDIVKYKGERREVLSIHPDYGIDIGDISRVTPDEIEEVYSKPISGEITPGPWRWMFNGNAGNYFLVGNDGRGPFIGNGPHSADGELMRSAWEMQADLATLRAEVERLKITLGAVVDNAMALIAYRDSVGPLGFQLEKADDYINRLRAALEGGE